MGRGGFPGGNWCKVTMGLGRADSMTHSTLVFWAVLLAATFLAWYRGGALAPVSLQSLCPINT